ncbi:isochorismatase [Paenibacillus sp. Root52]|uniref:Nicotinamidase-related amidase n=1 Tax=Paenibacillus amylolyticus TaxID=1451 RepID=A0AAP5HAK1_PAEAM|nr:MULTISPECIES: isochorismatase family cysteine hydrolase [Paenibacillus]KQY84072.1 isochorismatase [Paenibacillus sp. Root52]MDR6726991.1 nicotinamidase-related amidase [Paenibacillus amylolyticus]
MKIGLLIVDMQEHIVRNQVEKSKIDHACEYINHVADALRSQNHVVIQIQDVEGMDEAKPEEYRCIPEIDVKHGDLTLTKLNSNAFWQTELEQVLSSQNVELVIISGFAAEECVTFTYHGAGERGYTPVLLQNGILSSHPDAITSALRDRNVVSYPVIDYLVK